MSGMCMLRKGMLCWNLYPHVGNSNDMPCKIFSANKGDTNGSNSIAITVMRATLMVTKLMSAKLMAAILASATAMKAIA